LNLAPIKAPGKPKKPIRIRPNRIEGYHIQFALKCLGNSFVSTANRLGITPPSVRNVIFGYRRSARIEAEIARLLGKADWNTVVLEARSEIQKKPVEAVLNDIQQTLAAQKKAGEEELGAKMGRDLGALKNKVSGKVRKIRQQARRGA